MPNTIHPSPEVIASWPKPNYTDPTTRGHGLFALSVILILVGGVIVSIRSYTRLRITRAFGLDDYLIVLSYLLAVALSVLVILGNQVYHSGRHIWDVPVSTFAPHRENIWLSQLVFVVSSCLAKISVLLFYRRLSISFSKTFLVATYVGLAFNVAYLVVFVSLLCTLCDPLNTYWNSFNPVWAKSHENFHCRPENISLPVSAGLSVLTDFYATVVPLLLVATLKKSTKDKIALYGIFSAGFLVVIFGIVRTIYVYITVNVDYDFTWRLYDCWIFTQLELYCAIFAASAPTLRPLFNRCVTASRNHSRNTSKTLVQPSPYPQYTTRPAAKETLEVSPAAEPKVSINFSRPFTPAAKDYKSSFVLATELEAQSGTNSPSSSSAASNSPREYWIELDDDHKDRQGAPF